MESRGRGSFILGVPQGPQACALECSDRCSRASTYLQRRLTEKAPAVDGPLLKEIAPRGTRVVVLRNPASSAQWA